MKQFSTPEVAKLVGVHTITLERWLSSGRVATPKRLLVGSRVVRLWNENDVKRILKYKQENYRKGRGRKPKR
jgi:predicted site-specific integrase-resolvase